MKIDIKIPAMGESISEATIGQILKPSGSQVAADDEILELETDKVNQVIYAPKAGKLTLNISKDEAVKIDQVIGFIETDMTGESEVLNKKNNESSNEVKESAEKEVKEKESTEKSGEIRNKESQSKESLGKEKNRLSKEAFIADVTSSRNSNVEPKNEGKSISQSEKSKETSKKISSDSSKRETRRKMSKIRKVIAQRLVEAQHTTAMLTTFNEVDLSLVMALREKYKESFLKTYGTKLGFMSFFVQAVVSALEAFPDVNSYIDGDEIVHREYYDIGIAVGTDKGLVVPVVRGCDHLSFAQIEQEIELLAKKAREGGLSVDDLQGGGFTITNGGTYGSLLSTPIINFPQSAILGMHKIEKRPVVINDQIVIRPMMYLALSYDHRIIDGKEAVSFLVHIKNLLEDPSRMLLEI